MPSRGKADTDSNIELLADELSSFARLDWRGWKKFKFEKTPVLAGLLHLEPGRESVDRLRGRLVEITQAENEAEKVVPPPHRRSLAAAWLVLFSLSETFYDENLTERRERLYPEWRTERGKEISSVQGFTRYQEPYIYRELAIRLLGSEVNEPKPVEPAKPQPRKAPPVRSAPWPVPGYEPSPDQEVVILIAAHAMRAGPTSGLVRLVREFEPYWRATGTMVYALEGTFKEIWRAGLLHDYDDFAPLTAGFLGGLVEATEVVIVAADPAWERRAHVVYMIDPHDTSALYPATASLKRECLLTRTPFLTNYHGAARWFRLEWARLAAEGGNRGVKGLLVSPPEPGSPGGSVLEDEEAVLALAAHDRHKLAMMDFADRHVELLDARFPDRWATKVTGHVLNGGAIGEEEDVLSDVGDELRKEIQDQIDAKSSQWRQEQRSEGPGSPGWMPELTKGRQGGVIQLAGKVLKEECNTILFFQDGETPREHDTEIQVLDRAAQLPDTDCLLLHDERSADRWAENLEICLGESGTSTATTLVEAFRRVFEVELVLAHPGAESGEKGRRRSRSSQRAEDSAALWARITTTAAIHIVGALRTAEAARAEQGEPVRFGFPWGGAIRDVLGRVKEGGEEWATDTRALAGALGLHEFVDEHPAGRLREHRNTAISDEDWLPLPEWAEPFGRDELRVVPTVGVIGALDRSLESHALVERAVQILGGEAVPYPESAFALVDGRGDSWRGAPKGDWENLDVLLLSAAPLQDRSEKGAPRLATALPADLASDYRGCEGAVGTIYLEEKGGEVHQHKHHAYRQVGMSTEKIKRLKAEKAEVVLVNGAEEGARQRAAWAALKAGLATTFITDEAFAWAVLKEEKPDLKPPD